MFYNQSTTGTNVPMQKKFLVVQRYLIQQMANTTAVFHKKSVPSLPNEAVKALRLSLSVSQLQHQHKIVETWHCGLYGIYNANEILFRRFKANKISDKTKISAENLFRISYDPIQNHKYYLKRFPHMKTHKQKR